MKGLTGNELSTSVLPFIIGVIITIIMIVFLAESARSHIPVSAINLHGEG